MLKKVILWIGILIGKGQHTRMCVCVYVCIYIYIYRFREREWKQKDMLWKLDFTIDYLIDK